MSRPDLYRAGNASSPCFDHIREGHDVIVKDGKVGPTSGGISAFAKTGKPGADEITWVLQSSAPLGAGLTAINNHGGHWLIAPSHEMTLEAYKTLLTSLNSNAVLYDHLPQSDSLEADPEERALKELPEHRDRGTRFVYIALAAVVRTRIPVAGWDANDYAYITELAHALEDGAVPLSALQWDPAGPSGGWSRERAFAAHAVSAYMAHETARAEASGDEDDEADVGNDNGFLTCVLKLDDAKNPFVGVDTSAVA